MEIRLNDKITLQPVCLMQGENNAGTLRFSLPRAYLGCALHALRWQVRCTNKSTMAFMADALLPEDADDDTRFILPWTVSSAFTGQCGALAVTLVGSGDDVTAKFVVEGIEVAPNTDGGGEAPQTQDYFELAVRQTGQNAVLALESATLAGTQASGAKTAAQAAAQSAQDALESADAAATSAQKVADNATTTAQSAQQAAQSADAAKRSAQQAAGSAEGMDPNVYDPGFARQDVFALLSGMPPVYTGREVRVTAGAGRITGVCLCGQTARGGSGTASMTNPRPLSGVETADVTINGKAISLPLSAPLLSATNPRTGEVWQDVRHLSGREVHHLAIKTFTGTENFTAWGNKNTTFEYATDAIGVATLETNDHMPAAMCSHFAAPLTPNQVWSASVPSFSASYRVFFRTQHATAAEFKQWLAQQYAAGTPVQVVYQRAAALDETKPDASPTLPEGENIFQAKDANGQLKVTLKRVFEA